MRGSLRRFTVLSPVDKGLVLSQRGRTIRSVLLAGALIATVCGSATSAVAQGSCKNACWIDIKTGKRVASKPLGGKHSEYTPGTHAEYPANDIELGIGGKTAFNTKTKQNYAREADGSWIDIKTGKCVPTVPLGGMHSEYTPGTHAEYPADDVELGLDRKTAFNTVTKQNYAREACPSQTAAQPATPQVGMVIEPKISVGGGGSSGTSTYDSTGGQAPFNGDWSRTNAQLCGGVTLYPGFVIGPARVGLDVNICSGSNTFGSGDTTLFKIQRHGPGDVDLRSSTNAIIDLLFKGEVPVGPSSNFFLSGGIGPTFRDINLTLTSNQSFFGGGVPSVSDSTWQTGLGLSAGLSTFVCPNCIAGNPLKVGVEGRARFFPSQSINLRSPAFGFVEAGSTGRTTDYSALLTFGVPIGMPPPP